MFLAVLTLRAQQLHAGVALLRCCPAEQPSRTRPLEPSLSSPWRGRSEAQFPKLGVRKGVTHVNTESSASGNICAAGDSGLTVDRNVTQKNSLSHRNGKSRGGFLQTGLDRLKGVLWVFSVPKGSPPRKGDLDGPRTTRSLLVPQVQT